MKYKRQWGTEDSNAMQGIVDTINAGVVDIAALARCFLYRCQSAAGLAIGSVSKKTLKIVNTVAFVNAGVILSKATAAVPFTANTHDIAAAAGSAQEAVFLVSLAANGTPTITKGTTATGAGNAAIPATPAGKTPIAYARIRVAAGATPFDATTDDLDAAHLAVTYVDLATNPTDLVPTAAAMTEIA